MEESSDLVECDRKCHLCPWVSTTMNMRLSVESGGPYCATSLELENVGFEPGRFVEALKEATIRKLDLLTVTIAFLIR